MGRTHSTVGPVVTCHQLKIPRGIKAASLLGGVEDDIARDMGVDSVRITNGKNTVGLEIPNRVRKNVLLKEILESDEFQSSGALTLGLGARTDGSPMTIDLAKMPHLLVAGTTGSGKSVQLHCMIISMLEKSSGDNRKLILIDPKRVEFMVYQNLPQLVTPVITDMNQAGKALSWCICEMERRYALLSEENCRSVNEYNRKIKSSNDKLNPLIIVVDEFADLLATQPENEESLVRLAQKSRAASIHLILATQRPSSDIITPHLKANITARIAFKTSSKSNSRVILDESGAQSLLGQGDMLLLNPQFNNKNNCGPVLLNPTGTGKNQGQGNCQLTLKGNEGGGGTITARAVKLTISGDPACILWCNDVTPVVQGYYKALGIAPDQSNKLISCGIYKK